VTGLKVLMTYRVRRNVERCVDRGNVSLDEKEDVKEMFQAYKALGGNGHLDTAMAEVDRLPIRKE
ncbi:MAG: hypothetical protein SOR61_10240, partial [Evtepia sp.]|nr:hypothetical protein [Evtepia sp.]